MHRDGREVRSRTDYILVTDCILFQDVAVRDPQHQSYHYIVLVCLRGGMVKELMDYIRKAHRFPLCPSRRDLV